MLPKGGAVLIPLNSNEDELFIGAKDMGLAYPNDIVEAERYHVEWSSREVGRPDRLKDGMKVE